MAAGEASIAEVIAQKCAQLAARLELGYIPVEIRDASMHELDNETWVAQYVATLGLGIVGASREGRGNTPMVPPSTTFVG